MPRKSTAKLPKSKRVTGPGTTRSLAVLLLIVAPALVYVQTSHHEILEWDDQQHTLRNPYLMPPSWNGLGELWRRPYFGVYVPMAYTYLAAETWIANHVHGKEPPYAAVYHLGLLVLHVANGLLVFGLLRRFVHREWSAVLGALLFSLHPLQVESVAWVSETRGLLAALFGLAAILLYLRWIDARAQVRGPAGQRGPSIQLSWVWYGMAVTAFVLAILSKPSAAAIPLVLAIIDVGLSRRAVWPAVLSLGPWLGVVAIVGFITRNVQNAEGIQFVTPVLDRPLVALDAITFYLYKLVCPWNLATDYGRTAAQLIGDRWTWLSATIPFVIAALILWRRSMPAIACAAIFVAALLPVLGFIPFAYQGYYSTVADRYAYVALLAPALGLAFWLDQNRSRWPLITASMILAALGALSFVQAGYWQNQQTLFAHTLAVSPNSALAWDEVGLSLRAKGETEKALACFYTAQKLHPGFYTSFNNAGTTLMQMQRAGEAIEQFQKALRLSPQNSKLHYNMGLAWVLRKGWSDAERCFIKAMKLDPNFVRARLGYALALDGRGEHKQALRELDRVLDRDPKQPNALSIKGQILSNIGQKADAEKYLVTALRLNPADNEARQALRRLQAPANAGK